MFFNVAEPAGFVSKKDVSFASAVKAPFKPATLPPGEIKRERKDVSPSLIFEKILNALDIEE